MANQSPNQQNQISEKDFITKFENTFGWKPSLSMDSRNALVVKNFRYDESKRLITHEE